MDANNYGGGSTKNVQGGEKRRKRGLVRNLYIGLATLENLDLREAAASLKKVSCPLKLTIESRAGLRKTSQASRVPAAARPKHRQPGGHGCLEMEKNPSWVFVVISTTRVQVEHLSDQ